ncbi:MAG: hypothetical protein ABIE42_05775 [Candidatus Eisenbacteria bacterium]
MHEANEVIVRARMPHAGVYELRTEQPILRVRDWDTLSRVIAICREVAEEDEDIARGLVEVFRGLRMVAECDNRD